MYVHKYISLIIINSQYSQISTYLISLHHIVKHLQVRSDDVKNNTKDKMSSKGTIHFIWECTCNIRLANLLDWVAYYIMQMYCTALFVHVIRYAEHDRTTDPEMESAGWQLACRKGRDVTCPETQGLQIDVLTPSIVFINTRDWVWLLKAPSFSGPKGDDSFFEAQLRSSACLSSRDPTSGLIQTVDQNRRARGNYMCRLLYQSATLRFTLKVVYGLSVNRNYFLKQH
jgi:hypothetical protein